MNLELIGPGFETVLVMSHKNQIHPCGQKAPKPPRWSCPVIVIDIGEGKMMCPGNQRSAEDEELKPHESLELFLGGKTACKKTEVSKMKEFIS